MSDLEITKENWRKQMPFIGARRKNKTKKRQYYVGKNANVFYVRMDIDTIYCITFGDTERRYAEVVDLEAVKWPLQPVSSCVNSLLNKGLL